ncbi:inhibitor of nuclear factor kappa-B kinase-interacting protein isoform X2 [Eublepharis macularius]|uniref:Inhibitor of nuclear factor kappa-B kinase-interacting protein isoform X2 n=1 Tax=Eublepharis macularius TaxID=481883 RepID=A0AA97L8Z3_EUBMA|nr:inhibitor of nuclear factor kappa-B kinase-interacting protein isoform X2 [Eublepharis macularius]
MSEIKQRRKTNTSAKLNEEQQKLDEQLGAGSTSGLRSLWMDPRTAASCLSLTVCVGLTWFLFQQSAQLIAVQEKFHLLKEEAVKFQDIETKIEQMSTKCEKTVRFVEQDLQLMAQMKHLQEEIDSMQTSSKNLTRAQELQQNLTTLFHAVTMYEKNMASVTKNFSIKIASVKTDIRRISGLEADVTLLVESLHTLEHKVDKVEKTTIQSIGNLLTNSIDRTAKLQSSASENERQLMLIKTKLSELNAAIDRQSNKLLDLESDRAKVLKTVAFANDLKPKVYNLKKDFAHLEPMIDELTLRIGRMVGDLMERQKEIAYLYKELSNLTSVQNEVNAMNDERTQVSDLS